MNPTHAVYLAETLLTHTAKHHTGIPADLDPAYLEALNITDELTRLAQTAHISAANAPGTHRR